MVARDPRFRGDAYHFLREALDYTQKIIRKSHKNEVRHVTGRELLDGIRDFALAQFGPMTVAVLAEWGVHTCEDFGEIVFNMVEHNVLAKTDTDSREDFKNGYTFEEAFQQPFVPSRNKPRPDGAPTSR